MVDKDEGQEAASRVGLAAHGLYYLLLAALVALLVRGGGGGTDASAKGALAAVARQPFGRVVLVAVAVGFAAYGWHRGRQALEEGQGLQRLGRAAQSLVWVGLAGLTVRTIVSPTGGGSSTSSITATVLGFPGGSWIVAAAGVVVLGVAIRHAARVFDGSLAEELQGLDLQEQRAANVVGSIGSAGRALAFATVGVFVVVAAVQHDPERSNGLDGALQDLIGQPFGPWLVGSVAFGFAAFGCFRLVESRYGEVEESQ